MSCNGEDKMEIYCVKSEIERAKMLDICKNLCDKNSLIPVIGSGFSLNTPTDNDGYVPSSNKLKDKLYHYVALFSGYSKEELADIEKESLPDIAKSFEDIFGRISEEELKHYYEYVENNFCEISFFKGFQKEFLDIDWPRIFTLNYDTLIEDYDRKYYPVVPFSKINKHHENGRVKVYKLHGDAKKYLETGENKYFVLSRDQYIKTLKDDSNVDMLNELLTAFSSKSILFIGCGLSDELDLLYSSQLNVEEKIERIDKERQSVIYLSFEGDDEIKKEFSQRKKDRLKRYGITKVFRFSNEKEMEEFFKSLKTETKKTEKDGAINRLEKFSSIRFNDLEPVDKRNREFLFNEGYVWTDYSSHVVLVPTFYVERSISKKIINKINQGGSIYFISGNFYSGKTMALLQIARFFSEKKVYLFPTGTHFNEQDIRSLLQKKNTLFCFDTRSITTAQIKMILDEKYLDGIRKNNSCLVVAIDNSDAPMYKYFFESRNKSQSFDAFLLSNSFDTDECELFNKKGGAASLPVYRSQEPLLDYIIQNEQKLENAPNKKFLTPEKELLTKNEEKRIMALIMLATEIKIPAKRAIQFGIDKAIEDIIDCEKSEKYILNVIEKDYSVYNGDSSGFEFVCNSRYWVIRALSEYANKKKASQDVIAKAYLNIIEVYRLIFKDDVAFYQNAEPYYFFDHIQTLFNPHWFFHSAGLMNCIYDSLLPALSGSYQFLHQKAKGKLIIAQVQLKNHHAEEAKTVLIDAVYNITRAIGLAEKYPNAKNIDETLLHMAYTEGRIRIEQSCISNSYILNAVDACYKLYQLQAQSRHDIYDYATAAGNDKWAFQKFRRTLLSIDWSKMTSTSVPDREKVEYLLQRWTGKRITVSC